MNIIKVDNLIKRYGDFTAVKGVCFTVEKGSMLGFLGVNGAGKTTVINMLATLLKPDEGSADICGFKLGAKDVEIRKRIGIVYQQNCLDEILTVRENLMCRGIVHGASKKEARAQLVRLSEILGLKEILDKKYKLLSGGQKRKCEIAAALMHTPELLFLDEPTTGLDPATRRDVWNTIKELQKNEKMTIFLTTHYMEEAAGADKIIIMDKGSIIAEGTAFELKEKYAMDRVKLYLKNGTIKEVTVAGTMAALPVIEAERENIEGFEVIQGNMDDVFLNAVGKGMEGEE